jgi:hypothetical protein
MPVSALVVAPRPGDRRREGRRAEGFIASQAAGQGGEQEAGGFVLANEQSAPHQVVKQLFRLLQVHAEAVRHLAGRGAAVFNQHEHLEVVKAQGVGKGLVHGEERKARHDGRRTMETYEQWLMRFLRFHQLRHPREMGSVEVNAFLTQLVVEAYSSAASLNKV